MANADVYVFCGSIVPEGTMVCYNCECDYSNKRTDIMKFKEKDIFHRHWYQKFLFKLYLFSIKKSR